MVYTPAYVTPKNPQTSEVIAFAEMTYLPFLNILGAVGLEYSDYKGWYNWDSVPLKEIAFGIIVTKWVHTLLSNLVRFEVALEDISYSGDLFGAATVKKAMTYFVNEGPIGKLFNSFVFIPLLYQSYQREELFDYLPSMVYLILDADLGGLGFDTFQFGKALVGFLGAVQPFNDIFLLFLIFCTQRSSFYGDIQFFTWTTAYIPLIFVSASWLATQAVATWANVLGKFPMDVPPTTFDSFPLAERLVETISFIYMIWPTVLVSAYNFL